MKKKSPENNLAVKIQKITQDLQRWSLSDALQQRLLERREQTINELHILLEKKHKKK